MSELQLDVRLDGFDEPIGVFVRDDNDALAFAYREDYLLRPNAVPLSLSMPLRNGPFADVPTRAFFNNLLQERDGHLRKVMATYALQRDDVAGLLMRLGKDCPGAISVLEAGSPPAKIPGEYANDYEPIAIERMEAIVSALHNREELPDGTADPSPLAGVQSKIALTKLPNGFLAEPRRGTGAPTTHILKAPDRKRPQDAALEFLALKLSAKLGIETAEAELIRFGGIEALLIKRFDRAHDQNGRVVRIHQEDFAQALGLPAELKYERRGTSDRCFNVDGIRRVLNQTKNPAEERIRFVRQTLFDLAIGNMDAHAKNHAILHSGASNIRVSPRYDLLPTQLDPALTTELPYKIGTACKIDDITARDFDLFLKNLGIENAAAQRRMRLMNAEYIARNLADNLSRIARYDKTFADLIATNLRTLLPKLDVAVPEAAESRDTFVARGGGWRLES